MQTDKSKCAEKSQGAQEKMRDSWDNGRRGGVALSPLAAIQPNAGLIAPFKNPFEQPNPYMPPVQTELTPKERGQRDQQMQDAVESFTKKQKEQQAKEAAMRVFVTGATRNIDVNKHDYEGFISPLVLEGYGAYMHEHRIQADGTLRAADNWQKGIPLSAYQSSLIRHVFTAWALWRGWPVKPEQVGLKKVIPTLKSTLYAVLFNVMGYLHELEKESLAKQNPEQAVPFKQGSEQPIKQAYLNGVTIPNPGSAYDLQRSMGGAVLKRDVK